MMRQDELRQRIEEWLAEPPPAHVWSECWQSAQYIFFLHPYLGAEPTDLHGLQERLHERIDEVRHILESMAPQEWGMYIEESLEELRQGFELAVGNLSTGHEQVLHTLQRTQKSLDALQWLTSEVREEEDFILAESFADLGLIEREVRELLRASKEGEAEVSQEQLGQLDERLQCLRNELLERESSHYLHETEGMLSESQEPSEHLSLSQRSPSKRTGSRPSALSVAQAEAAEALVALNEGQIEDQDSVALAKNQFKQAFDALDEAWLTLRQGEDLLLEIHLEETRRGLPAESGLTQRRDQLELHRQRLKEKLLVDLEELSPELRQMWLATHLQGFVDELDETLASIDEVPMDEALIYIRQMETQMAWLDNITAPLAKSTEKSGGDFPKAHKQLKRMKRRMRAEAQEKKLQARLEGKFGRKAVAFSENLILFLILLVVALLTVELVFNLKPSTKYFLMWVDTAICAIFLAEFFTRLYYVEKRGLFFRRHFLIDFLPSIPFTLIFHLLAGPAVSHVSAGRAARLLRLSRLARYMRIIRPLIRIFRVLTFVMRAADRLVRKYETVFNRNVLLFPSPEERRLALLETPESNVQALRERCRKRMRMTLERMEPQQRLRYLEGRTLEVENQLTVHTGASRNQGVYSPRAELLYFEQLINKMLTIDEIEVEELLGRAFIDQASRVFRFVSAPGVRILPGFRGMARAYKERDDAAMVAWLIRRWGRFLERIQWVIHWFGDLYGIVTGPQVLDRIGLAMINATLRPARRLLLFGFSFLIITLTILAFDVAFLKNAASFLAKFLGVPIVVLGLISLLPLALGFWFRMIAGETTDYFARISEAQFITRLKQVKEKKRQLDLRHLAMRVLVPEAWLRRGEDSSAEEVVAQLRGQLAENENISPAPAPVAPVPIGPSQHALPQMDLRPTIPDGIGAFGSTHEDKSQWVERDRVLLLYDDYLDGTPLHRSDTKTTNHLLGNVTIQNIRTHRLNLNLVQQLRIEKLDLSRPKLLLYFGPYLWFASITESLTHRIARLLVEYNQNCIPEEELDWLHGEEREAYQEWLERRAKRLEGIPQPPERQKKNEQEFRTTEFSALHFLSTDPERDQAIESIFGTQVMKLMQKERKLLMRELFGYTPFHRTSKDKRTFNLFQLYQRHMAQGRVFLLPFKSIIWFFMSLWWLIIQTRNLVRDVLRPPSHIETQVHGQAGFDVAIRKINRMRKPIYTECMRLRAAFDVEYLGLLLPGSLRSGLEASNYLTDLEFIGASNRESLEFEELRHTREEQLLRFDAFLQDMGWRGPALTEALAEIHPKLPEKQGEILRAMTAAFASDYKSLRTLLEAHDALEALFDLPKLAEAQEPGLLKKLSHGLQRLQRTLFLVRPDVERQDFLAIWQRLVTEGAPTPHQREAAWHQYLEQRKELRPLFKLLASLEHKPLDEARDILEHVMRHSSIWSEELLTLRTLQTLTQLDIQLYRELVHTIGEYES